MIALIISSLLATYAYGSSVQEAVTCGAVIKLKNKDTVMQTHYSPIIFINYIVEISSPFSPDSMGFREWATICYSK